MASDLNYHHLLYFWTVARQGTVLRAAEVLGIGQPAISKQLKWLEESLGNQLFRKSGRNLVLTETGQTVYRYADEIFTLGQELVDVLRGHPQGSAIQLVVGIRIAMPKLMTLRLLEPALNLSTDLKLICIEDSLDRLLDMLAVHRVDIILSDCPVPSSAGVRFHNHLLSESATGLFATQKVAKQCRRDFPRSLNGVPFLLPVSESNQRKSIDLWLINNDIQPFIRGEFSDSALLKAAGRTGEGVFPGTVQIRDEICRQYECEFISEMAGVVERFYVISTERKNSHPAIAAITKTAMRIE